ncbi:MAG: hypothetical protein ABEH58_09045 [Haloplanus sp.]
MPELEVVGTDRERRRPLHGETEGGDAGEAEVDAVPVRRFDVPMKFATNSLAGDS